MNLGDLEAAAHATAAADNAYTRALGHYQSVGDSRGQIAALQRLSKVTATDRQRSEEYARRATALEKQIKALNAAAATL
jgi:hypothetical protein